MPYLYALIFGAVASSLLFAGAAHASLRTTALRTEYRENPLGIEERVPRFTWQLESEERQREQTAYQVLVADGPERLARDEGSLWDSGKVSSNTTALIAYGGLPLQSRMQCWWKVRVWDNADVPAPWSEPARFSMGLLDEDDWRARWIGYDSANAPDLAAAGIAPLDDAHWIWHPEGNPREDAPRGRRFFRRTLVLPQDKTILNAQLLITADDAAQVWINGRDMAPGRAPIKDFRKVYHYLTAALFRPGKNVIAVAVENGGGPAGWIAALRITFADGTQEDLYTDSGWKSAKMQHGDNWRAPDHDDEAWESAQEIARFGDAPWDAAAMDTSYLTPAAHLRRDFKTDSAVTRATLYVTALGIYELRLNGERVGEHYFTPGWTNYHKRLYYHTYDVTAMVRPDSENVLGALLANGWYAGHVGHLAPGLYGHQPHLLAQLEIEYADGRRTEIVSDEDWRAAHGEIRGADLIMGETRDLRQALTGWDAPGYNDADWVPVSTTPPEVTPERIEAYPGAPVKRFEEIEAVARTEARPGVYIYDLGQNLVGRARVTLQGQAGQTVRVRHTEMLEEDGMLYTDALRGALATNLYHLAEDGEVTLEPSFTFHGFRYVELRGVNPPPAPEEVTGVMLQADVPLTAEFECSNPLLNQLAHNIAWGLKGNYLEAPTDCPQRDERLGWTGDAQFFMPTALYTADIGAFFTKWMVDLAQDAQLEDGSFAHVAPDVGLGGGAVAWGDAALICPWLIHRFYGDTRIIERHFDNMVKGMDFLERTSEKGIRSKMGFGDWLNLGGGAKDEVICTAYFAHMAEIMAEMAGLIGRDAEAARFAALHQQVRDAFIEAFLDDEGRILESSQTGYALAFAFNLIPEHLREKAAQHYVEEIERFDGHLATGFIGTPRLLPSLSRAGRDDVAYQLLMNTGYPSWLYQVTLGATTMWERWNGWTPEDGFADARMNSFNHYAFGAVGEWLYSHIAGIQGESPGFGHIRIAPMPGGGLDYARMTYHSIRGPIRSDWRIEDNQFFLEVAIPANTRATVCIPTDTPESVRVDGQTLKDAGISVKTDDAGVTCEIGSGTYAFTAHIGS